MLSLQEIRRAFVSFFKQNTHEVVRSSPLIPHHDPSLLFTNSGMVQFKDVFTGKETRFYQRAVSAQKCLRAGGKHNDLDNVGYTARHHTFFEMLGNFSFGDYFKEEAIFYAWTLITQVFGLQKDRLLVTVYHEDEDARKLWKKIASLPDDRIISIATSDNFWSMGDTGPCGPCSEIFYDHGEGIPGGPPGSPDQDGDRFVEIWNLVFMQFEQTPEGTRIPLPKPSIDTGMGLERIAAVLQGVHNNYDIDLFKALIEASVNLTSPDKINSHRVIADHLRSSAFLIADGILPSNEGRGYVLRRIMRRAMRHAHLLGAKDPLMWQLVPVLVSQMGQDYPELEQAFPLIQETLKKEEENFRQTLERGLALLQQSLRDLPKDKPLQGSVAFKLYDTYGFPIDLTEDVLRGEGRAVDHKSFQECMDVQRQKARRSWSGSGEKSQDSLWSSLKGRLGATQFLGYQALETTGKVQALIFNGQEVDHLQEGQKGSLLTDQTCFYGESGGQKGDVGLMEGQGICLKVLDTQKFLGDLIVHEVEVQKGTIHGGDSLSLKVNQDRRKRLAAHHSATHLLQGALRQVLGKHITQKGSLVEERRLRFDFTHPQPLSLEERRILEDLVNSEILKNKEARVQEMPYEDALQKGAIALFGEKYQDQVRVVALGDDGFSTELCGGTHVKHTGDIGLFKIISENGISSGVRRIEAVCGQSLMDFMRGSEALKEKEIKDLQDALGQLRKEIKALQKNQASPSRVPTEIQQIRKFKAIIQNSHTLAPKDLKPLADQYKKEIGSGIIVLSTVQEGKISLVVGITSDLTAQVNAGDLVQHLSLFLGGKGGGGRADLAQGGGTDTEKLGEVEDFLKKYFEKF